MELNRHEKKRVKGKEGGKGRDHPAGGKRSYCH